MPECLYEDDQGVVVTDHDWVETEVRASLDPRTKQPQQLKYTWVCRNCEARKTRIVSYDPEVGWLAITP